jgi:hypothetical protein
MVMKWYVWVFSVLFVFLISFSASADFGNEFKLLASDGQDTDFFGDDVAISGDTIIVGAYSDATSTLNGGSAYIFVYDPGSATWTEQQKLLPPTPYGNGSFGSAVAIEGDIALVGARGDGDQYASSPPLFSGAVYVYERIGNTWTMVQRLAASDPTVRAGFGGSVAFRGNTAVVGEYKFGTSVAGGATTPGSAYIFTRDPATGVWTEEQKLQASDGVVGDSFGNSVSIDVDTVVIGAILADAPAEDSGAAYVFTRSGGVWSEQQKLVPQDGAMNDFFGTSVSISGDLAMIGSYNGEENSVISGSVYAFTRSGGVWSESQKLTPFDGLDNMRFGIDLSLDGGNLLVGAYLYDTDTTTHGSAYHFTRDPGTGVWIEQQKLLASDGEDGDNYGWSVSLSGGRLLIGAYGDDDNGASAGAAYVYSSVSACAGLIENCDFEIEVPSNGTGGGWTSSNIGPYTGQSDGWVSANCLEGSCFSLNSSPSSLDPTIAQTVTGLTAGATYNLTGDYAVYNFGYTCGSSSLGPFAIDIDGVNLEKLSNPGCSTSAITWGSFETSFVAQNTDVTISFRAEIDGYDTDYAIDNIALIELQTPDIIVTPTAHDFGDITVTNVGTQDLVLGNLGATAPLAPPFSVQNDTCSDQSLTTDANCTFAIRFAPTVLGPDSDAIDIPSNDPDENPVYVNISGTGTAIPVPDIVVTDSVTPDSDLQIPFGDVTTGTTSVQTATITNNGNADLVLGNLGTANPLDTPFNFQNDTCSGQILTPAANCTFQIRFAPADTNLSNDSFDIPSNDPDENPVTVSVSGAGLASTFPDINVTDSAAPNDDLRVPFGSITVGESNDQTITIVNSGNADLVLGTIATANPLPAPFSIQNNACDGLTLQPSESCLFDVRFSPTVAGIFNESFDIPSDDPDEDPVTINVSGNGAAIPVPDITVTDTVVPVDDLTVPFGDVTEGLTIDQTITVSNDGNADLVLGDIGIANPIAEPFAILNDSCSGQTLTPASDCTFDIRFAPVDTSIASDSFDVVSNDPDEDSVTVNVSGTGLSAAINNPPGKPKLVFPVDGQQDVLTSVELKWQPVSDPDGDPVSYEVFYCVDADPFNNCDAVQVTSINGQGMSGQPNSNIYYSGISWGALLLCFGMTCAGTLRSRKVILLLVVLSIAFGTILVACHSSSADYETHFVSQLDSGTTYSWGVVAKDDQGGETRSDVWTFTTR